MRMRVGERGVGGGDSRKAGCAPARPLYVVPICVYSGLMYLLSQLGKNFKIYTVSHRKAVSAFLRA